MRNSTHSRTARTAWLCAAPFVPGIGAGIAIDTFSLPAVSLFLVGGALASHLARWPDVDHPSSGPGRAMPGVSWVTRNALGGHRGGTHSLLSIGFGALVGAAAGILLTQPFLTLYPGVMPVTTLAIAGAIGWASHILLGDCWTEQGCALAWPISKRKVSFAPLRCSPPKPAPLNFGEFCINVFLVLTQVVAVCVIIGGMEIL